MERREHDKITTIALCIASFIGGVIFSDVREIYQNPTRLEPEEGDARTLNLHYRSIFCGDRVERLELRKDGEEEEWMRKNDRGEWVNAFTWDHGEGCNDASQYP